MEPSDQPNPLVFLDETGTTRTNQARLRIVANLRAFVSST
ncbi:hypothetical protein SS05631_c16630 [Sinorhizobium sp. CCBAU 05631]|nr:hypothetical protein SS05631_c16630 [Sinorhizobium sp. CCBAU 05631]AWM25074.1 hypothetical protein AOX55_00001820 [Sinorhizobium fredii CCBAU 25509]